MIKESTVIDSVMIQSFPEVILIWTGWISLLFYRNKRIETETKLHAGRLRNARQYSGYHYVHVGETTSLSTKISKDISRFRAILVHFRCAASCWSRYRSTPVRQFFQTILLQSRLLVILISFFFIEHGFLAKGIDKACTRKTQSIRQRRPILPRYKEHQAAKMAGDCWRAQQVRLRSGCKWDSGSVAVCFVLENAYFNIFFYYLMRKESSDCASNWFEFKQ